jgi:hypothetical protein
MNDPQLSLSTLSRIDGTAGTRRHFRYFDYMMASFVGILLLSNLIGAASCRVSAESNSGRGSCFSRLLCAGRRHNRSIRLRQRPPLRLDGLFRDGVHGGDELCRRGHASVAGLGLRVERGRPVCRSGWPDFQGAVCQTTYVSVFGSTWRIVLASLIAFWAGEFVNSFVLARMKVMTQGRHLWTRTVGSTVFRQAVDSVLFYRSRSWARGAMQPC